MNTTRPRNMQLVASESYKGGSRLHTLFADYQAVVSKLGPGWTTEKDGESYPDDPDKTDACWCFKSEDNQILTIWNYKNGPNYGEANSLDEIDQWSVYTTSNSLWEEVKALFEQE